MSFLRTGSAARKALIAAFSAAVIVLVLSAVYVAAPRSAAPLAVSAGSSAPEVLPESAAPTAAVSSPSNDSASATAGSDGLSESEAVAAAREHLPGSERDAEVWATESGTFADVYQSLGHRPAYIDQPPVDGVAADRPVWGIEFQVTVDMHCPSGHECEDREGLTTIFIDYRSGEWLRASTFAPSPGESLPRPST